MMAAISTLEAHEINILFVLNIFVLVEINSLLHCAQYQTKYIESFALKFQFSSRWRNFTPMQLQSSPLFATRSQCQKTARKKSLHSFIPPIIMTIILSSALSAIVCQDQWNILSCHFATYKKFMMIAFHGTIKNITTTVLIPETFLSWTAQQKNDSLFLILLKKAFQTSGFLKSGHIVQMFCLRALKSQLILK